MYVLVNLYENLSFHQVLLSYLLNDRLKFEAEVKRWTPGFFSISNEMYEWRREENPPTTISQVPVLFEKLCTQQILNFLLKKKKLEKSNGKSNNIPKTVFFFLLQPLGVKMYWFDQKIIYQVIIPKYLP